MSNLSFRARALDASKPMPIYMAEELPDLPDYSAINRAVPQMPSGMQKEEECEHHLQRAICAGLIIPTPEVTCLTDVEAYEKIYIADCKQPCQFIHMQPFAMEQDIPDYDMDSEDERWVKAQNRKLDLSPLKFEEMMDRLEKSSTQTVIQYDQAKELLKEDDELIMLVFDYWLSKRLKSKIPLLLTVKTEHRNCAPNNPYLAFRRRTEKMQTRKNRKNDETSYEKMLKLKRDLTRAVTLLELVKRREKTKRELLHLTIEIYEKRYQAQDFSGQLLNEVTTIKTPRPAFAPLFTNQFGVHQNWANKVCGKDDVVPRKEKRQYKKRKHKTDLRNLGVEDNMRNGSGNSSRGIRMISGLDPLASSDEETSLPLHTHTQSSLTSDRDDEDLNDEGPYTFRRNKHNNYLSPVSGGFGNWPWCDKSEGGLAYKKYRFSLTSINKPTPRCIGFARRRVGRGGRVILDRYSNDLDDLWSSLDFMIHQSVRNTNETESSEPLIPKDWPHFRPKTPPPSEHSTSEESSDSDSEDERILTKSEPVSYPFPPEATSICIDFESDRLDNEPPFTTEFNISDYFPVDAISDFDLTLTSSCSVETVPTDDIYRTDDLGSSCVSVLSEITDVFAPQLRPLPQCSGSDNNNCSSNSNSGISVNTSNCSNTVSNATIACELNQSFLNKQHKQLINNSILSKSLTSPTISRSGSSGTFTAGISCSSGSAVTNFGNGHQNGPITHNANNLSNSSNVISSQSTKHLPQKHPPSNVLPGYNKLVNLARQQQQPTQSQNQTIPASGEITLNSNSEGMDMEVDNVQESSCDSKSQQQQLVQANKANSLAMEVT